VRRDDLFFALNATTHALRFARSAAKYFTTDIDKLEIGSETAASVAYINNRFSDAQHALAQAEIEIERLIQQIPQ
jgi:hypothetical protein